MKVTVIYPTTNDEPKPKTTWLNVWRYANGGHIAVGHKTEQDAENEPTDGCTLITRLKIVE